MGGWSNYVCLKLSASNVEDMPHHFSFPERIQPSPLLSRWRHLSCLSRQHTNIVDETLNKKVIIMWLATHGSAPLINNRTGVQLDFQLVYLDLVRGVLESVSFRLASEQDGQDG